MEYTNREHTDVAIRQASDIIDEGFNPDVTLFCTQDKNQQKRPR